MISHLVIPRWLSCQWHFCLLNQTHSILCIFPSPVYVPVLSMFLAALLICKNPWKKYNLKTSNTIDTMKYKPASYYVGDRYRQYLLTDHWGELRNKYIFDNVEAKCWVCETPLLMFEKYGVMSSNLLLHHVRYDNLFHERLYRDLYILCTDCHSGVHFTVYFRIFKFKTKLTRMRLYRKMILLKIRYCIRSSKFWLIPWYMLRYILL